LIFDILARYDFTFNGGELWLVRQVIQKKWQNLFLKSFLSFLDGKKLI